MTEETAREVIQAINRLSTTVRQLVDVGQDLVVEEKEANLLRKKVLYLEEKGEKA